MWPFRYKAGPDRLGIGVDNLALLSPGQPMERQYAFGPRYTVRSELGPLQGGSVLLAPSGPNVSLQGNGLFIPISTMDLTHLVDITPPTS